MSMLCIHNIEDAEGRRRRLAEAVRVCKRGGVVVISDLAHAEDYRDALEQLGLRVAVSGRYLDTFPFQRIVEARRAVGLIAYGGYQLINARYRQI